MIRQRPSTMIKTEIIHIPVLLNEVMTGLTVKEDGIYVDCTMGGAGHASIILEKLTNGKLYCFEQDDYAINEGRDRLAKISNNFTIIPDNFVNIKEQLNSLGVYKVDGILYDLGVSSFQLDDRDRGFSYHEEARLDMRMNQNQALTAYDVVNEYPVEELRRIIFEYGEEKYATSIAKKIDYFRKVKPIETTTELVRIVTQAVPAYYRRKSTHPARKTFQAIRIAVNDELNVFEKSLRDALDLLDTNGRCCVITFHSLEDRICKEVFKEVTEDNMPKDLPIEDYKINKEFALVNKKVITPSPEELETNIRSRSAKLRIIQKL
ncbi:MAG TPA: 16S rRNA (cytosine(1402)-N(4))-methyltransferase RsmH [Bacilli bacterium]|nr:16S rRNA (cytosine(1402)-N(4))-methyltransferase RsmH [Bacilli bacterium]HQO93333.1 16S rRNA (cytosine(1402)-N(4))-methyltransferase RsmH [Bacilli bacterium]HQQ38870.1 16S rRNA (cytosine(1402)-N(4))-methyltransferase RsmH [Bacilli bacterium]